MGWIAITKEGETLREETHGRPVAKGEEGSLLAIMQEDYGHKVAVDLLNGVIALDYSEVTLQNGNLEIHDPKSILWICEETTIIGELAEQETEFVPYEDEKGRRYIDPVTREVVNVRNDTLIPLKWRPIWFSRITNGIPTKVIGAQTTTPEPYGAKNIKKMVSLFVDGRVGID